MVTPRHLKTTIARFEWVDPDASGGQWGYPSPRGTESRPTRATQGQETSIALDELFAHRCHEAQTIIVVPSQPAVANLKGYALLPQAL